ncbi:MAG: flagellar biosynthetic protein FliO [Balneolaceae bacterium]
MDLRHFLSSSSVNPKQILKVVLSLSVVMLVIWLFMVSRMELSGPGNTLDPANVERADSIRTAISAERNPRVESRSESEPNIFMNAVTTFIVLISILGVIWVITRRKSAEGSSDHRKLVEIGEHLLGNGAQIKIIELNEEIWVLGVTSGNVNLLHRYQKDDWKEELNIPQARDGNFLDYFKSKL